MKKSITMKNKRTHNTTASFSRKVMTFLTALLFMALVAGFQTSMADEPQRIVVEPDDFPMSIGNLRLAIEQHGGDVIYVLQNGQTYFLDARLQFPHFLHIEAEEYPSNNPPIIRPGADSQGSAPEIVRYLNDAVIRGIFFFTLSDLGEKRHQQRIHAEGVHLTFQHCYFMGAQNYFFQFYGADCSVRIEDSQLANSGRHTSVSNQRFIDARNETLDSVIVINTSIYNINFHLIRSGGNLINYIYWDHVTAMNHSLSTFDLAIAKEVTITNSLFHNTNLDGAWESAELVGDAGPGYDGPRYHTLGGMINISSIDERFETNPEEAPFTDAERSFVIKNNNFGGLPPQEYLDLWENEFNVYDPENNPVAGRGSYPWGTDRAWLWANPDVTPDDPAWALRDTIQLVRIQTAPMDSLLTAWANQKLPNVVVENNIRERVTVPDLPQMPLEYLRAVWYGTDVMPHWDRWNDIVDNPDERFFHPGPGSPIATTGPTASWFRDLAYNMDSQSYTLADRGYPVGNLNFYPDLKELWDQGEDAPFVSVQEIQNNNQILAYPNPVRDALYLSQEVDEIRIFSLLGQQVISASNVQSVNVSGLPKGVYILSIVKNNQVSSQKIVVTR